MSKKHRMKLTQMEIEWLQPGDPGYRSNPDQNPLLPGDDVEPWLDEKWLKNLDENRLHNASDMEQKSNI